MCDHNDRRDPGTMTTIRAQYGKAEPPDICIGSCGACTFYGRHDQCPETGKHFTEHPFCACACHIIPTEWCAKGKHKKCAYSQGGRLEGRVFVCGDNAFRITYTCPCPCHMPTLF
jgi:hypothetical protein